MASGQLPRRRAALAIGTLVMTAAAACSGGGNTGKPASTQRAGSYTLKVAYGSEYVFNAPKFAKKWWAQVGEQFKATHPNATVQYIPIAGSYNDIVKKLSSMYNSPSTAPDVAELPTAQVAPYAASNDLLPLNDYLKNTIWWPRFPPAVQSEGTVAGKVFGINHGENTSALVYNKEMFRRAGLPVPWAPKNWSDVLFAAARIKAKIHGVTPIWALAGEKSGANGLLQGFNNLLFGTNTPTIYDPKTNKYVVDSPGIRQALGFYSNVYSQRLGAGVSELFSPNAVTAPLQDFKNGKTAIAIGSNYWFGNWNSVIKAPEWPEAANIVGVAPIPRYDGGDTPVSTLGGWDLAVYAKTKVAKPAFDFIDIAESAQNSIDAANWAGWVPPDETLGEDLRFLSFAANNETFARILPFATLTPTNPDYPTWAEGMNRATGLIAQHPHTTIEQAVDVLKKYVTGRLGANRVETR